MCRLDISPFGNVPFGCGQVTRMESFLDTNDDRRSTFGKGWRFVFSEPFGTYFPTVEFRDYAAFLGVKGEALKTERRTRVVLLHRRAIVEGAEGTQSFVLKEYHYPLIPRIRTWLRISKAEQEFNNLRHLGCLGVQAGEPAAFGEERSRLGFVRSCFLITCFVEDAVSLRELSLKGGLQKPSGTKESRDIFKQVAEKLRRLHRARFFLFTAKAKNILMRRNFAGASEILFIDVPYGRYLRWRPMARWAQGRDLGVFLGSFSLDTTERERTAFFEGYLPDPLGRSARDLQRHVKRAIRRRRNQTLISSLVHRVKQSVKKTVGS